MLDLEELNQIRQIIRDAASGNNPINMYFGIPGMGMTEEERRKREEEEARRAMEEQAMRERGRDLYYGTKRYIERIEREEELKRQRAQIEEGFGANRTLQQQPLTAGKGGKPDLEFGGYGQAQHPQGFWESVWTGISNTLTIFDPLLFVGDVSKAFIYGLADGGFEKAFSLAGQQLSNWETYLPGGERVKQVVGGEDLARKFIDDYDQLKPWQRFGYSLMMEVVTDPLSVFGVAALAAKGTGAVTRGAASLPVISKVPGAGAIRSAGGALESLAPKLEKIDTLTQQVANPYAIAVQGAKLAGKLPVPFSREVDTVGEAFGLVLDKALSIKIRDISVNTPGGVQHKTKLTIGNFFLPFGDTVQQQADIFSKLPHYTGGETTGASAVIRAKAYYQEHQQRVMSIIEDANRIVQDGLGKPSGIFKRNVVPKELHPFVSEMAETAGSIITKYGIADSQTELQKAAQAVRQLAKSYGVDEDVAEDVFRKYHQHMQNAYLETIHAYTGMPLYEQLFKASAQNKGLDPDEAWTRYLGLKAGRIVPEKVNGQWVYKSVDPPPFVQEIKLPINRDSAKVLRELVQNAVAPNKEVRAFMSLNVFHQAKALDLLPNLQQKISDYTVASQIAADPGLQAQVLGDIQNVIGQMAQVPGDPAKFKKSLQRIRRATNPYEYWDRIDEAVLDVGSNITNLLQSSDKNIRGIGHAIVGSYLESQGLLEDALIHYGVAAKNISNREAARFIYALGAPQIGVTPQQKMRATLLSKRDIVAIANAKEVNAKTAQNVINTLNKVTPGVMDEAIKAIENGQSVYAQLVQGITNRDKGILSQWASDVITGKINATSDGVELAMSLLIKMGMENELYQVMSAAGKTTSLANFRAMFARNLLNVEQEALEEFMRMRPNWMGAATTADLVGETKGGKWTGNPFSPVQYLENIKNGYARKIYAGNIAPEAAMGALMKGGLTLIAEIDPTKIAERTGEWMQRMNITDPNIPKAIDKVVDYISNAGDRFAYSTNSIIKIMQSEGVNLSPADFNSLINHVLNADLTSAEAIKQIGARMTGGLFSVSRSQMLPGSFAKRVPGADWLVAYYDPAATLNELNRHASRNAMSYYVLESLHKDLKVAGMIFDDANVPPADIARLKLVKVPERIVNMGDGAQALAYGPLSGKWIPSAVWDDLVRTMASDPLSRNETFAAFLSFWRKALLNNPKTVLVNIIGNEFITWANMGPTFAIESWKAMPKAIKAYANYLDTGKLPQGISEGALHFLRETSLNKQLRESLDNAISMFLSGEDITKYREGIVYRLITKLDKNLNEAGRLFAESIGKANNLLATSVMPIEVFSHAENIKRLANYIAAKNLGMDEAAAMWSAANATFNYGQLPYGIQMIRNTGLAAFPSFAYFTTKAVTEWVVKRPAALTLPQRISQSSFSMLPDEGDQARAHVYMEDWLRNSMPFVIPYKRQDGSYIAIPLSNLFPIRPVSTELFEEAAAGGWLKPFVEATWGLLKYADDPTPAGYPLFSARYGDILYKDASTLGEAIRGTLSYVARQFIPTYATRTLPILDTPALVSLQLGNAEAIANIRSIAGRSYAQYSNPAIVAELERRTGRIMGYNYAEFTTAFIGSPRPAPVNPFAPGANTNIRKMEREVNNIERALRQRVLLGQPADELKQQFEVAKQRLSRQIEPYKEVIRQYGPPKPLEPIPPNIHRPVPIFGPLYSIPPMRKEP